MMIERFASSPSSAPRISVTAALFALWWEGAAAAAGIQPIGLLVFLHNKGTLGLSLPRCSGLVE